MAKMLIKSTVKQHQRRSKSGKISTVREHQDSRQAKLDSRKQINKLKEKRNATRDPKAKAALQSKITAMESAHDKKHGGGTGLPKTYHQRDGVGRAKYTISKHDGQSTNKDGSPFFDIAIFKNKPDLNRYIAELHKQGYKNDQNPDLTSKKSMDEFPALQKAIETTALKSLKFKKTGKEIIAGIESKIIECRLELAVLISKQGVVESNKVTVEAVGGGMAEAPVDDSPSPDYSWKINGVRRKIEKLERYARNLKPNQVCELDGYELQEFGL